MDEMEAQRDEILVLQSIFDESQFVIDNTDTQSAGCIFVKPQIDSLVVSADVAGSGTNEEFSVEHLYPLELHFNLPPNYPSEAPPHFTLVCKWLRREQVSCMLIVGMLLNVLNDLLLH